VGKRKGASNPQHNASTPSQHAGLEKRCGRKVRWFIIFTATGAFRVVGVGNLREATLLYLLLEYIDFFTILGKRIYTLFLTNIFFWPAERTGQSFDHVLKGWEDIRITSFCLLNSCVWSSRVGDLGRLSRTHPSGLLLFITTVGRVYGVLSIFFQCLVFCLMYISSGG
jgi:hypothetical protein